MRIKQTETSFSVILSEHELWFLAKFFSPGVIFGITDPYSQLDQVDINNIEEKVCKDLEKDNIIKLTGKNQYMIDELIGSMVYSCIHPSHTIHIKDEHDKKESYLHFLPDWHLYLSINGSQFILTIFKKIEYIWLHLIDSIKLQVDQQANFYSFGIDERDLELASYLYSQGKRDESITILLANSREGNIDWDHFLSGYINPSIDLTINSILYRNNTNKTKQKKRRFLKLDNDLFWVIRSKSDETETYSLDFEALKHENLFEKLSSLLPERY